jgi:hypothetical protein
LESLESLESWESLELNQILRNPWNPWNQTRFYGILLRFERGLGLTNISLGKQISTLIIQ